jgi:hypothetical protein
MRYNCVYYCDTCFVLGRVASCPYTCDAAAAAERLKLSRAQAAYSAGAAVRLDLLQNVVADNEKLVAEGSDAAAQVGVSQ